jgi:hypothetical protein
MPRIRVHQKALAHLSRGLYRSPASALRELVSNAWDANATSVTINTNYPKFFQLSVEDNGDGFTREQFRDLMEGGIGNSSKRPTYKRLIHGRQVIGRLGIGMLGIAQVCGGFTVTSKTRSGKGFRARVQLWDLLGGKIDRQRNPKIVDVGTYEFEEVDLASVKEGTKLLADDVHPSFIKAFQGSLTLDDFQEPPRDWAAAVEIIESTGSVQQLGDYWRLLWELSASCPVPYLGPDALPRGLSRYDYKRISRYGFAVAVDGILISKPVALSGNEAGYTYKRLGKQKLEIFGNPLRFHGYLLVQEGRQIKPDELRGILIRIKDVGIGYYDPSMLDYPFNEGPRSRWLRGEIFVDEGLEDALNIDRDSFNRFHPEFRALQEHVHDILHKEIFPDVYREIEVRTKARAKQKSQSRHAALAEIFSECLEVPVRLGMHPAQPKGVPRADMRRRGGEMLLRLPRPQDLKTKRSHRELGSAILAAFEIAMRESGTDAQRERFYELLMSILAKAF